MNFNYSEEQLALQDTLRRFIDKDYRFERRRMLARSEEGFSREVWGQFADLGLLAMPFPEQYGGIDGNAVDTMLVMEGLGRGLVLEPYLSTVVLAGSLLRDVGETVQKQALLPSITSGKLLMAVGLYEPHARYALNHVTATAEANANGYLISGTKCVVLGGPSADKLIISARTSGGASDDDGVSLFIVDRTTPGLIVHGYATHDDTRAADIEMKMVQVAGDALLGERGKALRYIERAIDYGISALCAEAVGVMTALNEATLEYLKIRKQFGQQIGRFQALQHRMVDMVIATEQARSMAILAAVRVNSTDSAERKRFAAAAKTYVGLSARTVGQAAVQLHGGMGVVDELIVSHYFKRLTMIIATLGDTDHHLDRFSTTLLAA
jgi:alkylation response protein AidB-like acyl-CoA dehydrogenase